MKRIIKGLRVLANQTSISVLANHLGEWIGEETATTEEDKAKIVAHKKLILQKLSEFSKTLLELEPTISRADTSLAADIRAIASILGQNSGGSSVGTSTLQIKSKVEQVIAKMNLPARDNIPRDLVVSIRHLTGIGDQLVNIAENFGNHRVRQDLVEVGNAFKGIATR